MEKKKKLKTVRRCSICNKTGHNTRTCPLRCLEKKISQKKSNKTNAHIEKKVKNINIKCFNNKNVEFSPHVINLNIGEKNKDWEKIIPYKENEHKKNIYQTLSFSEIIKKHKSSTKKENFKNTIQAKKIKEPEVKIDILAEIAKLQKTNILVKTNLKEKTKKNFEFRKKAISVLNSFFSSLKPSFSFGDIFKPRKININFDFVWNWRKMAFSSMVLFLLVAVPYPSFSFYKQVEYDTARIVDKSSNAFLSLQSSTVSVLNSNVRQAEYDLSEALKYFGGAEEILENEYKTLVYIAKAIPFFGKKIKSRQNLLEAGHKIALGNAYLVKAINEISQNEENSLLEKINIIKNHVRFAKPNYKEALEKINEIKIEDLDSDYQKSFEDFRNIYSLFVSDMENITEVAEAIELFMGRDGFRRYMVLFQNQNEIRSTGGFIGSYAIVDIQNAKILDINIPGGGSYDLQGQLKDFVLPPMPLQIVNKRWEFQDANWFPNFPDTAKKIEWFYQNSRNSTLDGVIAVNASVLERVLKVLGPLQNDEYNIFLDAENALQKLQYEVENYEGDDNRPKAVLSSLFNQLFSSLDKIEAKQMLSLIFNIHESLEEKEIQLYFKEKELYNLFSNYNWAGEIKKTDKEDYLFVVNSNIGGGKSDFNIEQTIEHQSYIDQDGSIINTVIVTREHIGDPKEYFFGDTNVNYIRLYVPKGSQLLEAGGFIHPDEENFKVSPEWYREDEFLKEIEKNKTISKENGTIITEEYDKTVFANWIITNAGEKNKVYFIYKLPFKAFSVKENNYDLANIFSLEKNQISNYNIIFQKQSGVKSKLIHTVIYPDDWVPVWRTDESYNVSKNGAKLEVDLKSDLFYGLLLQKK